MLYHVSISQSQPIDIYEVYELIYRVFRFDISQSRFEDNRASVSTATEKVLVNSPLVK